MKISMCIKSLYFGQYKQQWHSMVSNTDHYEAITSVFSLRHSPSYLGKVGTAKRTTWCIGGIPNGPRAGYSP